VGVPPPKARLGGGQVGELRPERKGGLARKVCGACNEIHHDPMKRGKTSKIAGGRWNRDQLVTNYFPIVDKWKTDH